MEQNLPIIAKKVWKIVQIVYFMLRKGISKGKLLADLSMLMKRGKIAGKAAIHNLMFHHGSSGGVAAGRRSHDGHLSFPAEYEFSCSNSPAHAYRSFHLPFHLNKRKHSHPPPRFIEENLMAAAMEMVESPAASPALPGFGPSPMVRQLRITDSPFPVRDVEEDSGVDAAAEEFIMRFYKDLRKENSVGYLSYYS